LHLLHCGVLRSPNTTKQPRQQDRQSGPETKELARPDRG
jgi:hypothetical protein